MEESKSKEIDKSFFNIKTSLTQQAYRTAESLFSQSDSLKIFNIIQKNKSVGRLHSSRLEDEEFIEAFKLFEENNFYKLELPNNINLDLIPFVIRFFYFREVKSLSLKEIFDFLKLTIFFCLKDLVQSIGIFLKSNLDELNKVIFIRLQIFPFVLENSLDIIKEVFDETELFLLKNNFMENFLSFYAHHYFSVANHKSIEEDLFKKLDLMKKNKIADIYRLKLLTLFKDKLILIKCENEKFEFRAYAQRIIEKFINIREIKTSAANVLLSRLCLDINEYKLAYATEKIVELESRDAENRKEIRNLQKEVEFLKENSGKQYLDITNDHDTKYELLKNEYDRRLQHQKNECDHISFEIKMGSNQMIEALKNDYNEIIKNQKTDYNKLMEKLEEKFQQQFEVLKKEFDQKLQNKNNIYGDAEQAKNELVNQLQSQINNSNKQISEIKNEYDISKIKYNQELEAQKKKFDSFVKKFEESQKKITITKNLIKNYDVYWASGEKNLKNALEHDTTISSNLPLPQFFKIKIKLVEMKSKDIVIGLTKKKFLCAKSERSFLTDVIEENEEYGYDPKSSGYKFSYRNKQEAYGETCEEGDILSIIYQKNSTISFKRNAKSMGVAFNYAIGPFYLAASIFRSATNLEIISCKAL